MTINPNTAPIFSALCLDQAVPSNFESTFSLPAVSDAESHETELSATVNAVDVAIFSPMIEFDDIAGIFTVNPTTANVGTTYMITVKVQETSTIGLLDSECTF